MALPTTTFAEWLRASALFAVAEDAAVAAAWGDDAPKTERVTALATAAGADAEAIRQQAFMEIPMAIEEHVIAGRLAPYVGKTVTITCAQLGYDAGLAVFVLGAVDDLGTGTSKVTVLRRLV